MWIDKGQQDDDQQGDRKGSPLLYREHDGQRPSSCIVGAIPCGRPGDAVALVLWSPCWPPSGRL
ncbi:MAG TPA: hypothetical protein VKR06_43380 [Ktedonosporobacter sp.]|nr:hypothetical protein [Ktedonosporobacter sp.]